MTSDVAVKTETKVKIKRPSMYQVILLNDDFTPMEFVIDILMECFEKSEEEAKNIMLLVHHRGQGVAGIYPFEIAEEKRQWVTRIAQSEGHPLKVIIKEN